MLAVPPFERLSLVLPMFSAGGAERVFVDLANHWARQGRDIELICGSARGPFRDSVERAVLVTDLGVNRAIKMVPGLVRRLALHPLRPVLSTMPHTNVALLLAGRMLLRHRGPIIVQEVAQIGGCGGGDARWRSHVLKHAVSRLYRRADRVLTVADDIADALFPHTKIYRQRMAVIPNPVPLADIAEKAQVTCAHPWLESKRLPVVLAVGRLSQEKDFATLLRAFTRLYRERDCRLVVLGAGPEEGALKKLANELMISEQVDFAGFQINPWSYMARADLIVVSSIKEGFGLVIVEALTCGTNVISVDCGGGPRSILAHSAFGPLPPVRDPLALARAMGERLDNPLPPDFLREQAGRFSIGEIAKRYEDLIVSTIEDNFGVAH